MPNLLEKCVAKRFPLLALHNTGVHHYHQCSCTIGSSSVYCNVILQVPNITLFCVLSANTIVPYSSNDSMHLLTQMIIHLYCLFAIHFAYLAK